MEIRTAINLLFGNIEMCNQLMVVVKTITIILISIPIVYILNSYVPFLVNGNNNPQRTP